MDHVGARLELLLVARGIIPGIDGYLDNTNRVPNIKIHLVTLLNSVKIFVVFLEIKASHKN
jgi:hypothetical protein